MKAQTEIKNSELATPNSALPPGWQWVRLGEVCDRTMNRDPKDNPAKTFQYVDISSVDNRLKRITEARTILGKDAPSRARQVIKTNDVLVATTRPNLNAVALVPKDLDNEVCSTGFCVLRPSESVDPLFLFFFVQTGYFVEIISGQVRGMMYPAVTDDQVRNVFLPLPSLSEQKRIAAKLQELMEEIEHARTACEKQLEAAKALPAAYLRQVFESEEAKRWERKRLEEVLKVIESGSRPKGGVFEIKEGIPSIGAEHLNSYGGFNFDNMRYIPREFYEGMNRGKIQKGDVLVVKDGATTGKVSFVGDDYSYTYAAINEHVFRLRGKGFLEQEFLFWFLYSPLGQTQIQQEFHGAAQGGINQQFVNGVHIPIPPISIQQRIAANLKEKMAQVQNLQSKISNQLSALNALPQAILRKVFRGEL